MGVQDPAADMANEVPPGLQGRGRRRNMPFGPSRGADRRFVAVGARNEDTPMGYPEPSITTTMPTIEIVSFQVEGMTCASCVNRITRFLGKVEGVEEANINLASDMATVRFDPRQDGPADARGRGRGGGLHGADRPDRGRGAGRRTVLRRSPPRRPPPPAHRRHRPDDPAAHRSRPDDDPARASRDLHRAMVPVGPRDARPVLRRRSVLPRCAQRRCVTGRRT